MISISLIVQSMLTFIFLYALIFMLERKRRAIDPFMVAVAAIAPIISAFLLVVLAAFFGAPTVATIWVWVLTLIVTTFIATWRMLELSTARAAAYTAAVFAFGLAVQFSMIQMN